MEKYNFKLERKGNDYDEYIVKCFKNGNYYELGSYYTDNWEDAKKTIRLLALQYNIGTTKFNNSILRCEK